MRNRSVASKAAAVMILLAVIAGLIIGCGNSGTSDQLLQTTSNNIQDNRPAAQPQAVTETLSQIVQANAGVTIQTSSGPVVIIPPGAISNNTTVKVEVLAGPGLNPPNPNVLPAGNVVRVSLQSGTFLQPFRVDFAARGLASSDAVGFVLVDGTFLAQPVEEATSPRILPRAETDEVRPALFGTVLRVTTALILPGRAAYEIGVLRVLTKQKNTPGFWTPAGQTTLAAAWPAPSAGKRYALVLHGINADAKGMTVLFNFLRDLATTPYDGIVIYQYDYTNGAQASGDVLYNQIRDHIGSSGAVVDIFAHSFGGVVSRYMAQEREIGAPRRISRVFMFGTPNNGCPANQLPSVLTSLLLNDVVSIFYRWEDNDPTIQDLRPNHGILPTLNNPSSPGFLAVKNRVGYYLIDGDFFPQVLTTHAKEGGSYAALGSIVALAGGSPNDGIVPTDSADLAIFNDMAFWDSRTYFWNHSELIQKIESITRSGGLSGDETRSEGEILREWIQLPPPPITPPAAFSIERVSVSSSGTEGNDSSSGSVVSGDGRHVAFLSFATNLDIAIPPASYNSAGAEVLLRDRVLGTTELISKSSGNIPANGRCDSLAISANGRYVAFTSTSDNLAGPVSGGLYIYDRQALPRLRLVTQLTFFSATFGFPMSFSADGRYLTFTTDASLVPEDTNSRYDLYLYDQTTTTFSIISTGNPGGGFGNTGCISPDGRYIIFGYRESLGSSPLELDVFLLDRQTGLTSRILNDTIPFQNDYGPSYYLSEGAQCFTFAHLQGVWNVFVRNPQNGVTDLASMGHSNQLPNGNSGQEITGNNYWPSPMSADGRFVVYASEASNLIDNDTNGGQDIFLYNSIAKTNTLLSRAADGTQAMGAFLNGASLYPSISSDGKIISFSSYASNLIQNDTNGASPNGGGDVFVVLNPLLP